MDRRKQICSEESAASAASVSSITDSLRSLLLDTISAAETYVFSALDLRNSRPEVILRGMLSTKSAISTDSSLAEANQRARDDAAQQLFEKIGGGQCGTVYALKGTTMVIKLPNSPEKEDILYTDCIMHKLVRDAFTSIDPLHHNIKVPKLDMWVKPQSTHFWATKASLFTADARVPNYGLVSERIYPIPSPVRAAIVDALSPPAIVAKKKDFLALPENKDCLIRLYLGRRNDNRKADPKNFKLRNFPLHVDEMERIGLNTETYALVMAQALAVMHWKAGVDATDVEFVLGSHPQISGDPTAQDLLRSGKQSAAELYSSDFEYRTLSIWLLDFNECKMFKHDEQGIQQLVKGFWFNDPYYPRPNTKDTLDKKLWQDFSRCYLKVAEELIGRGDLPERFIRGVEEEGQKSARNTLFG